MAGSCSQNAIDYKKKLVDAVSRLQKEDGKYKEELYSFKERMQEAGSQMQKQFERVHTQLTLLHEEDKTADDSHSGKETLSSSSATAIKTSSRSVDSSVPTEVIQDSDKMVKQLTAALGYLHRGERLVLTEKLIKELKKMRAEGKKVEKATRAAVPQQKKEVVVPVEEKPQLLQNGEITAAVSQGSELKACDSMLTIQMIKDAALSTAVSTSTTLTAQSTNTA